MFQENGFTNGMTGSRAGDNDLMVAQIDSGATTRTIVEADAFRGTIDIANADMDGSVLRPGTLGAVTAFDTRINKDSTVIAIAIAQPTSDAGDVNDAAGGNMVGAPATNSTRYLQVVQTGRPAAELGTSILATLPKVPALESTGDYGTGNTTVQRAVTNFNFQIGLMNGSAATDGGPNLPEDSWQSNANRMYFTYEQLADVAAGGNVPDENRLFTAGIEVTAGAAGAAPTVALLRGTIPAAAVTFANTSPGSGSDTNYWGPFRAQAIDRGVPAGDVVTFFAANDNHVADGSIMGSYEARRLYAWDGSQSTLVSSAGTANYQTLTGNASLWLVDGRIHVVFSELAGAPNSEEVVAARSYAANAMQFVGVPAIGSAPAFIDIQNGGAVNGFQVVPGTSTVGVYIEENHHVYYNETRSDAAHYRRSGGLSDPTLVDNDASTNAIEGWSVFMNDGNNALRDSFFMYAKYFDANDYIYRGYVRVHD